MIKTRFEYFSSIKKTNNVVNNLQNKALVIDEYVDEKLNQLLDNNIPF